jgi:hypothetical protein
MGDFTITSHLDKRDPVSRQRCMACKGGKECHVVNCDQMAGNLASKFHSTSFGVWSRLIMVLEWIEAAEKRQKEKEEKEQQERSELELKAQWMC